VKSLHKRQVLPFLERLLLRWEVYAPVRAGGGVEFTRLGRGGSICLDFPNSRIPPKSIFFPQKETMFRFEKDEQGFRVEPPRGLDRERILFGMRPCDVHAMALLDRVFGGGEFHDPYYLDKRKRSVIVTIGCNQPAATCFCSSTGSGPFSRTGADLFFTDIGESYVVDILTKKGGEVVEEGFLADASSEEVEKAERIASEAAKSLVSFVEVEGLEQSLDRMGESPFWARVSEKCTGCAICTFLCPTCHCFDMADEGGEFKGKRVRHWDSCLFPLFTQQASGHNPRPTGRERMRQRIMHKFNYFVKSFGEAACVGCGRCIIYCPVNFDIRKVIEGIKGQEVEWERSRKVDNRGGGFCARADETGERACGQSLSSHAGQGDRD